MCMYVYIYIYTPQRIPRRRKSHPSASAKGAPVRNGMEYPCICIYVYMYVCMYMCVCIYTYHNGYSAEGGAVDRGCSGSGVQWTGVVLII